MSGLGTDTLYPERDAVSRDGLPRGPGPAGREAAEPGAGQSPPRAHRRAVGEAGLRGAGAAVRSVRCGEGPAAAGA